MSFSIFFMVLIVFLAAIVYFHYVQGFFSSVLSAIFAVVAAVVAFSYHEVIVESLLAGKAANYAHAMVLLMTFALVYLVLRIIADMAIPGQVRLPAILDKVGGAVMGLIAGIFALGILTIAAEELPLGPSIAGYVRYVTKDDHSISIPGYGGRRGLDAEVVSEVKSDELGKFDPEDERTVLFDDAVVKAVTHLSKGGSLEGRQPLTGIHPDFLQELFGQRLGIEPGGKHLAMDLPAKHIQDVVVKGVYALDSLASVDSDPKGVRVPFASKVTTQLKAAKDEAFLVVRLQFSGRTSADEDRLFRFSPASVRLVAFSPDSDDTTVNYYPIGTLTGSTLYANKIDDFLVVNLKEKDKGADLVFRVKRKGVLEGGTPKARKVLPGVFIEMKRLAREDLSGNAVVHAFPPNDPDYSVMRKMAVLDQTLTAQTPVAVTPPPGVPTPPPPVTPNPAQNPNQLHPNSPQSIAASATNSIFAVEGATVSDVLPIPIAVGTDTSKLSVQLSGGDAIVKANKFNSLNVDVVETVETLGKGPRRITQLVLPPDQALLQVTGAVPDGSWTWGEKADQFEVIDAAGKHYKANGAWAMVQSGKDMKFFARYSNDFPLSPVTAQEGKIIKLWLSFGVPHNTEVKQLVLGATAIGDLNAVKVP